MSSDEDPPTLPPEPLPGSADAPREQTAPHAPEDRAVPPAAGTDPVPRRSPAAREEGTLTHGGVGADREAGTLAHGGVGADREEGTLTHGGVGGDREEGTLPQGAGGDREGGTLTHGGVGAGGEAGTLTHGERLPGTGPRNRHAAPEGDESLSTIDPSPGRAGGDAFAGPADVLAREWRVGDVIDGRYEVRALLGRGGMGQVVRVFHREWSVDLAVKTPLPRLVSDPAARMRFLREAETWVALGLHPNVVACWYVRELDGMPRLFLDHVAGGSLKQALREGRVRTDDLPLIMDLALQACDGLAHAHRHGVVHRDVKPANLLLTRDGRLQVTDFGLVRRLGADEADGVPAADASPAPVRLGQEPHAGDHGLRSEGAREHGEVAGHDHTVTGAGLGTPEYAAPEQWSAAHQADARADVYALGVTLFEMCCGRRPFDEPEHPEPAATLIARHMTEPAPDARTFAPDLPDDLAKLIGRCLRKQPELRHADAAAVRRELVALYPTVAPGVRPRPEPRTAGLRAGALNNRGVSLWDLGRPAPARDAWDEALALSPHHPEASYNRALVAWRGGQSLASELARLDEARMADRSAALRAGLLDLERLAVAPAVQRFAEALEQPSIAADPLGWRALGLAMLALDREADAVEALAEALRRAPDDTRSRRLLDFLRTGRGVPRFPCPRDIGSLLGLPESATIAAMAATPDARLLMLAVPGLSSGQSGAGGSAASAADSPADRGAAPRTRLLVLPSAALGPSARRLAPPAAPANASPQASRPTVSMGVRPPDGQVPPPSPHARTGAGGLVAALRAAVASSGLAGAGPGAADSVQTRPGGVHSRVSSGGVGIAVAQLLTELPRAAPAVSMEALGTVTALGVTPDGTLAASVTAEGHLELWVLRTGGCRRSFAVPGRLHVAVALIPDGTRAVLAAGDGSLALWDLEQMDVPEARPAPLRTTGAVALAASPSAARVASGHADGRVLIWDLGGRVPRGPALEVRVPSRVEALAFAPDGRLLAVSGTDGSVHVLDLSSGRSARLPDHAGRATGAAFSSDGTLLVTAGAEHLARFHTVAALAFSAQPSASPPGVTGPAPGTSPAGSAQGAVTEPGSRIDGFDAVRHLALVPGGWLCGVGAGRALAVPIEAERALLAAPLLVCRGQAAAEHEALAGRFEEMLQNARQAYARRDQHLAMAFAGAARAVPGFEHDPEALALETRAAAGLPRRRLRDAWLRGGIGWHPRPVTALALAGQMLVTASEDSAVRVFDRKSELCALTIQTHHSPPRALALSADAMRAVTGDAAGAVWLLDLTGSAPHLLGQHRGPVHAALFLDERRAATAGEDGVRVWDVGARAPVAALPGPAKALCASGGRLGIASGARLLAWDAVEGSAPRLLGTSQGPIDLVVAAPAGELLITAGADRALSIWRPGTEGPVGSHLGHDAPIHGLALTPDLRFALSAGADGTVIAWELGMAAPHRVLPRAGEGLNALVLDASGSSILTAGQQVRQWDLDWEHEPTRS